MAKTSGFSFAKTNTGDVVGVAGKKLLPHRIELIQKSIDRHDPPYEINEMFFNFKLKDCRTESTEEERDQEAKLFYDWITELFEERQIEYNEEKFQKALKELENEQN